ncbi:hypothetical protein HPB50_009759 [Hyalomma asiaticum]|uniref:Uncharacterized protein n=1 Tax=Hyalomma asiaticum TaxID=266040 RepID=A0ACB7RZR2_HYAAI|nr:hypothetical protein HPB50_009759 [Hyalomma asiaticum]
MPGYPVRSLRSEAVSPSHPHHSTRPSASLVFFGRTAECDNRLEGVARNPPSLPNLLSPRRQGHGVATMLSFVLTTSRMGDVVDATAAMDPVFHDLGCDSNAFLSLLGEPITVLAFFPFDSERSSKRMASLCAWEVRVLAVPSVLAKMDGGASRSGAPFLPRTLPGRKRRLQRPASFPSGTPLPWQPPRATGVYIKQWEEVL